MVYEILPIYLGRISSPTYPKQPGVLFTAQLGGFPKSVPMVFSWSSLRILGD